MALDKFIYRLKNDEDITRQRLVRHEVLAAEPIRQRKRKRYLVADKHLLALAQRYVAHYRDNGDILRYLRCVQHHLQKPRFPGEPADVNEDPLEEVVDDDNGGDDGADVGGPEDRERIPRRESHPGELHGLEPEEEEHDGGDDGGAAEAAVPNGGAVRAERPVYVAEERLPGLSQADVVANRQPVVQWGPVQLPSQSSSAAAAPAYVRRPPVAAGSHRGPGRLAVFNALSGNDNV